jgi:hypothetical protein
MVRTLEAIDAIVATAQQILIESAQPVRHGGQATGAPPPASNCPAGASGSWQVDIVVTGTDPRERPAQTKSPYFRPKSLSEKY